jgi:hypothetical protein
MGFSILRIGKTWLTRKAVKIMEIRTKLEHQAQKSAPKISLASRFLNNFIYMGGELLATLTTGGRSGSNRALSIAPKTAMPLTTQAQNCCQCHRKYPSLMNINERRLNRFIYGMKHRAGDRCPFSRATCVGGFCCRCPALNGDTRDLLTTPPCIDNRLTTDLGSTLLYIDNRLTTKIISIIRKPSSGGSGCCQRFTR